jgi:hypothetical protein
MTTTINASTSSGLIATPDNSGAIALQNNGVTGLNLTAAGYPLTPLRPAFDVYGTGSFSANATAVFTGVHTNIGSCYSTSTGNFTAPVAGTYMFTFNGLANGGVGDAGIRVNGTQKSVCRGSGTTAACSLIITLAVNDQVQVYIGAGQPFYSDGPSGWSTFTGFLIG